MEGEERSFRWIQKEITAREKEDLRRKSIGNQGIEGEKG